MHAYKPLDFILVCFAGIASLAASASDAGQQDAIVTFYSHGNRWTTDMPRSNHGLFYGKIFNGENVLLNFREGFPPKNNLVISIHFPPGEYSFSAAYGNHAPKKKLSVTLNPGERYFLRAQSEARGIVEIEFYSGRLDEVSCATASEETTNAKELAGKKVAKQFAASAVSTRIPIACP